MSMTQTSFRLPGLPKEAYIGQALLLVWIVAAASCRPLPILGDWQAVPFYKALTGAALFGALLYQFALSLKRFVPSLEEGHPARSLDTHRRLGHWLPLLFLLHSGSWPYGILALLSLLLVANLLVGWYAFLRPGPAYFRWVGIHILLSVSLMLLSGHHLVLAIRFH